MREGCLRQSSNIGKYKFTNDYNGMIEKKENVKTGKIEKRRKKTWNK